MVFLSCNFERRITTMELTKQEIQYKRMTETPIPKLIMTLAIPTVISMLVTAIYNIADTYFVSQLGKSVSGAVSVVFSLMAIIQAAGFTLGMGASSVISRALGKKDYKKANSCASAAFFTSLAVGAALAIFGSIFSERLMGSLGATDTVLPYAQEYGKYILLGAPVMMSSFVLNNVLRAEGKATYSMVGLAFGGVLNVVLDPIFIFNFGMGISGAAIATIISQVISFFVLISAFVLGKSIVKLQPKAIFDYGATIIETINTGAPSFCRQGLSSISTILLNTQAGIHGGDAALSAMGIVSKVFMCIFCIGLGVGQGYQPVAGYNYSSGNYVRLKKAFGFTYIIGTIIMLVLGGGAFVFAPQILAFFIDDASVIEIGTRALRFQAITMPLLPINVVCNMTFQSLGYKIKAIVLSCCRQGLFFIPCVMILPNLLSLNGVELTQATADFLTSLVSIPFAILFIKEINNKISDN